MPEFEVTAIKTIAADDASHEHIDELLIADAVWLPRQTVVRDLRSPWGDRYFMRAGAAHADVVLGTCPRCGASDYITTAPERNARNSLFALSCY